MARPAFRGFAFCGCCALLTFLPVWLRRASQRRSGYCRAQTRAWQEPKRPSSGQGWPVDGPRSGCEAQGTESSLAMIRRRHRVAFLLVTFLWAKPKEKLPAIRAEHKVSARVPMVARKRVRNSFRVRIVQWVLQQYESALPLTLALSPKGRGEKRPRGTGIKRSDE